MNDMEMEKNRQVVQDGLNKRANKRKQSIREAEQEAITVQMFAIINANACSDASHIPAIHMEAPICKTIKKPSKKLIKLRNVAAVNMVASFVAFTIPIVLYAIHLMEISSMFATLALPVLAFIYNLCIFAKAQKKLKRRK